MKEELMRELISFGLDKPTAQEIIAKYSYSDLDSIIGFLNNYGQLLKIN